MEVEWWYLAQSRMGIVEGAIRMCASGRRVKKERVTRCGRNVQSSRLGEGRKPSDLMLDVRVRQA